MELSRKNIRNARSYRGNKISPGKSMQIVAKYKRSECVLMTGFNGWN